MTRDSFIERWTHELPDKMSLAGKLTGRDLIVRREPGSLHRSAIVAALRDDYERIVAVGPKPLERQWLDAGCEFISREMAARHPERIPLDAAVIFDTPRIGMGTRQRAMVAQTIERAEASVVDVFPISEADFVSAAKLAEKCDLSTLIYGREGTHDYHCPECGHEAWTAHEEMAHMRAEHPDVLRKRLEDAGFDVTERGSLDSPFDKLAVDG